MTDQNCATRNCKPCTMVKLGDIIDPNSKAHIERNACNRCPTVAPKAKYVTKRIKVTGQSRRNYPSGYRVQKVFTHFEDSEGNIWDPDTALTAWWFHDDPFPGFRSNQNMTFRIFDSINGGRGWQCRYENGVLDDVTTAMGTYDFAEAGGKDHVNMDVSPHNANPNYKPNLTMQFGATPRNAKEMQEVFSKRREEENARAAAAAQRQYEEDQKWQSYVDHVIENGNIPLG